MFKKLLAGLTAVALSLGMVALTAAPASAHHSDISATFACTGPSAGTITWTVHNWNGGKVGRVESSTNNIVPVGTEFASDETKTFTQSVTAAGTYPLAVTMTWKTDNGGWANQTTNNGSIKLTAADFVGCDPNETAKVDICHANNGNGWVAQSVSVNSIIKTNGHAEHQNGRDIIPPFSYAGGSFPGLNWDAYGQWVKGNGCSNEVTAAKPAFVQAVCTAAGQVGGAGYTIVAVTGVRFERSANGSTGWTEVLPGFVPTTDGTSVWIRAVARDGYALTGNANQNKWQLSFTDVDPTKCVTPVDATATYSVCTAPGQSNAASYRIPYTTGVQYQRLNGATWVNVGNPGSNVDVPVTTFPTTVQLRAVAKPGFTLVGGTSAWTFAFGSPGNCLTDVVPATPAFTDSVCNPTTTGATQGGYLIPTTANVSYSVSLNGAAPVPATTGSFVTTHPGDVVILSATPASGYQLKGYTGPWNMTFANPGDCLDDATPITPTAVQSQCTVPGQSSPASYTITPAAGVRYESGPTGTGPWTPIASSSTNATPGTSVWVRAVAEAGYRLAAGYDGPWKLTFTNPGDCITKVTPAAPDFTSAVCLPQRPGAYGQASYTIPSTTGARYEVKVGNGPWTAKNAGTYSVGANADVRVRAIALTGYVLQGTTTWQKDFTAPDCLTDVTAAKPSWTQAYCTAEEQVAPATFVIPEVTGVAYQELVGLTWVDRAPGSHATTDGTILTLRAIPLAGYELTDHDLIGNAKTWFFWIPNIDASEDCIVPVAPTFVAQVCTAPGDPSTATFTIPSDTGVRYQVKNGASWQTVDAGTYDVTAFPSTVEIRALPRFGYHFLDGATTTWSSDFTSAGDCIQDVAVGAVTAKNQTCVVDLNTLGGSYVSGAITIPTTPNVSYFIDGVPAAAGDNARVPGTYTVTAVAAVGYKLTGYTPWTLEIGKAAPCGDLVVLPVVVPLASFTQATCVAPGSYTLGVDPAELASGVVWTVSGGLPATPGTHSAPSAGTVTITAVPAAGYGFGDGKPGALREWSFTFAAPTGDCLPTLSLPTLAMTGSTGIAAGGLGVVALLTLGGALLVIGRRRNSAPKH